MVSWYSNRQFMVSIKSPDLPILIIDDNVQYVQVLTRLLAQAFGYKDVTSTDSIDQGYELIAREPSRFGLLFIDYNFPSGQTGGELLKRLQKDKLLDGKVAFLITSEPTPENVKEATLAGAVGVVAKPFDREQLRSQLVKAEKILSVEENSF